MTTTPPDTSPPPGPAPDSGPRVGWDDIRDLARIRRSRADRRVAGVAGGLGRHLDIDPLIVRVAFVVLTFFGGVGLLLYLALWLLLPEDGSDWATIKLDRRSRTAALLIVGVVGLALLVSHGWWGDPGPFLFLVVLLAVVLIVAQLTRRDRRDVPAPGAAPYAEPPTATLPVGSPPPSYLVPEQPRPVNPRKKGPILFWFALGTMAVALGALAVADLAGVDVAPSAYPATVLALSAAFLLLGSFFGRAGGLIVVGLLAAFGMTGAAFADHWDPHSSTEVPVSAAAVRSDYTMDVGEIKLDLTDVSDVQALDGRTVHLTGNVGHLEVIVPRGVTVVSQNHITGVGGINAFGRGAGGVDTTLLANHAGGAGAPHLIIDTDLHVGGIDVHVG